MAVASGPPPVIHNEWAHLTAAARKPRHRSRSFWAADADLAPPEPPAAFELGPTRSAVRGFSIWPASWGTGPGLGSSTASRTAKQASAAGPAQQGQGFLIQWVLPDAQACRVHGARCGLLVPGQGWDAAVWTVGSTSLLHAERHLHWETTAAGWTGQCCCCAGRTRTWAAAALC